MSDYPLADIRKDFPILARKIRGYPLCYLDNGASAQKPSCVIKAITSAYEHSYANVHRGAYLLASEMTTAYEQARQKVADFLKAPLVENIVFTSGATASINFVYESFGRHFLKEGDEVVITHLEHHSNIVPWQLLRDVKGIVLKVIPVNDDGTVDMDAYKSLLSPRTKLVSVAHVSNTLGTILPVKEIIKQAHEVGARTLIDGSQAVMHLDVDVVDLDADFYVFTGHKIYGPTGIGVLYGKTELLSQMPPVFGGGEMIEHVTFEKTTWANPPARFEAGTPPMVQAIGLGAALDYVQGLGIGRIAAHEQKLTAYALEQLGKIEGLKIYGHAQDRGPVISMTMKGAHAHDIAMLLDELGICVRAGHHCAEPIMDRFGVSSTIRVSFGLYNGIDDVNRLVGGLEKVKEIFR